MKGRPRQEDRILELERQVKELDAKLFVNIPSLREVEKQWLSAIDQIDALKERIKALESVSRSCAKHTGQAHFGEITSRDREGRD